MAIREILRYPDPKLRIPGETVVDFGTPLHQLIEDMAETMYAAPGVGLAAPQIGVSLRLFIIDVASGEDSPSELRVFANPEILSLEGEVPFDEGCLSFPGAREEILRGERVKVRAQDATGAHFELEATDLLAIAIQHENDHLDGTLMIDRLTGLRKRSLHKKMQRAAALGRARFSAW